METKLTNLIQLTLILCLVSIATCLAIPRYHIQVAQPLIIAHRTCPLDAPENSLAGIRVAAEQGADAVEIDLRVSLDQRPFLLHDWTMRRMTGFPLPIELTPSYQVRLQRLGRSQERVPSLADALDALPPHMLVAVDVKTPWAMLPLLREVKRRRMEARVLIWCTSALAVRWVSKRAPAIETSYLKDLDDDAHNRDFIARAKRIGAGAVSAHWSAIDADFVAAARDLGLRVYSFDSANEMTEGKLTSGLAGLITDHVADARAKLDALGLVES